MKKITILILLVLVVGFVVYRSSLSRTLPIFNPIHLSKEIVDPSLQNVSRDHTVGSFELIDQHGDTITQNDFKGKIYVASFFFTTCPTICIDMNRNLLSIQHQLGENTLILSHSVTPDYDTPEILNAYAQARGIDYTTWRLTTGKKSHIYHLARKVYFAAKIDNSEFVHTESLVLVDPDKRLRGFYNGTNPKETQRLLADIKLLQNEYDN